MNYINLESPLMTVSPGASRRLYFWGITVLMAIGLWFISKNNWEVDIQTILGLIIMTLAARPALLWAKRKHTWFPAFEIAMLTCIPFYAIPLLAHHKELFFYSDSVIIKASGIVIVYIALGSFFFSAWKCPPKLPRLFAASLISQGAYRFIPAGLLLNNLYLYTIYHTSIIPDELKSIATGILLGISTLSVFISAQLWGKGLLSNGQKIFFIINIILQITLRLTSLYLITAISLGALGMISYSMSSRRIPWLPILLSLPILSILHLGKGQMRTQYWTGNGAGAQIEIRDIPYFFSEWINYGLQAEKDEKYTHIKQDTIFDRASLIHILCLSVDRVPREQAYLKGETYIHIPAAFIPRILWKNKSSSLAATQQLALYFNLIDPDDPLRVSIAFGMLAEAYINFGYLGAAALAALFGWGLNRIALSSAQMPQFSAIGILSILLTAWCLQVEQTAQTWVSSLFQVGGTCIGIPLALKAFTSRAKQP